MGVPDMAAVAEQLGVIEDALTAALVVPFWSALFIATRRNSTV